MNKPENRFEDEPIHLPEGASYSKDDIEEMQEILDVLKPVPDRDPETAATGRKVFIQQARTMPIPVSPAHEIRHKGWNIFKRKERSPMTVLARVALVLALVIGGSGATAFAAQASMPSDILYPVKLFTEDFRLALTTDPEVEFNLLLELAQERSNEITKMANAGESVPARVNLRLENHLRQATQLAATRFDDESMVKAMEQLRTMAKVQTQTLMQVQNRVSEQADEAVRNAHQTMAQMEVVAQGAMEDPTTFRLRQGAQRPGDAPSQPENDPPGNSSDSNKGAGKGECKGQGCAIENTCPPEMTVEECIDYLDICTVEMTEEECLEYYDSLYESGQGNRPW